CPEGSTESRHAPALGGERLEKLLGLGPILAANAEPRRHALRDLHGHLTAKRWVETRAALEERLDELKLFSRDAPHVVNAHGRLPGRPLERRQHFERLLVNHHGS